MSAVANNRFENTRKVTFTKDYAKGARVIYRKGEIHFIHHKLVAKLDLAKYAKVETLEFKAEVAKAKKALGIKN